MVRNIVTTIDQTNEEEPLIEDSDEEFHSLKDDQEENVEIGNEFKYHYFIIKFVISKIILLLYLKLTFFCLLYENNPKIL